MSARSSRARDPRVVAALEPLQDRDEQLEPVGRDRPRALPWRDVDVDADPDHDAVTRLGEDAGDLAAADEHVVRLLDLRFGPDRGRDRAGGDDRQLGPARDGRRRMEGDGEGEPGAGLVDPDAAESSTP